MSTGVLKSCITSKKTILNEKLEECIIITVPFTFTMYPHIATKTYFFIFKCKSAQF